MKEYKHVIWDWNGTLLDDVQIAINSMNSLLRKRELPTLNNKTYRNIFTFPVKEYYSKLGFDFKVDSFWVYDYATKINDARNYTRRTTKCS